MKGREFQRDTNKDFQREAMTAIKVSLTGLPFFCRLVIYEILTSCDYESGTIILPSLEELAQTDFQVDAAPGRKKETINGDTLRNAFRTIKKAKPEHFKFIVKNQRIIIEMPFLRDLYHKYFTECIEVAAGFARDVSAPEIHAVTDKSANFEVEVSMTLAAEDAAATCFEHSDSCAEGIFNILNKNKQNKHAGARESRFFKQPISPNFYPRPETIEAALSKGLTKVLDMDEIQKFIWHNQEKQSQWPDFNPVFLWWLGREAEHRQNKDQAAHTIKQRPQSVSRSKSNEQRQFNQVTAFERTMDQVQRDNPDPWTPESEWTTDAESSEINNIFNGETYLLGMDGTDRNVRHAVYQ